VDRKGWAHALAHAADALGEIAKHPYIKENELLELLEVINAKVLFSDSVYSYNEDERMALSVTNVIEKGLLSEQQILNWIDYFRFQLDERMKFVSDPDGLNARLNVRNFLYSLDFRLRYKNMGKTFQRGIEKTLDFIREF